MREPNIDEDGWSLDDGETHHREAPQTFWIPDLVARQSLQSGDFAKLIFRISVDNQDKPVAVERMWVIVRTRVDGGYLGRLDNEPDSIAENDDFWCGVELPFEPRHVIAIQAKDEASIALAATEPLRPWQ